MNWNIIKKIHKITPPTQNQNSKKNFLLYGLHEKDFRLKRHYRQKSTKSKHIVALSSIIMFPLWVETLHTKRLFIKVTEMILQASRGWIHHSKRIMVEKIHASDEKKEVFSLITFLHCNLIISTQTWIRKTWIRKTVLY